MLHFLPHDVFVSKHKYLIWCRYQCCPLFLFKCFHRDICFCRFQILSKIAGELITPYVEDGDSSLGNFYLSWINDKLLILCVEVIILRIKIADLASNIVVFIARSCPPKFPLPPYQNIRRLCSSNSTAKTSYIFIQR